MLSSNEQRHLPETLCPCCWALIHQSFICLGGKYFFKTRTLRDSPQNKSLETRGSASYCSDSSFRNKSLGLYYMEETARKPINLVMQNHPFIKYYPKDKATWQVLHVYYFSYKMIKLESKFNCIIVLQQNQHFKIQICREVQIEYNAKLICLEGPISIHYDGLKCNLTKVMI